MTHYAKHRVTDFLVPERHHTSKTNCVLIVNDNCCESPQTACRNQRNQNQHRATKIPGEPTMSLLWSVGFHCGYLSGDAANDRGRVWRGEDVQHGTAARSRRCLHHACWIKYGCRGQRLEMLCRIEVIPVAGIVWINRSE